MSHSAKAEFLQCFKHFGSKHNQHQVFSDFVAMAAAAIHNSVVFDDALESGYLAMAKRYDKHEMHLHAELLAHVVNGLEETTSDILGDLFMSLELGNARAGQFFTPYHVSQLMAKLTFEPAVDQDFTHFHDPACGAGSLPIAFSQVILEEGGNPQNDVWMQCWDVDSMVAHMCFIQLSLLHVPAEIVIGNSLSLEIQRTMKTPAHYLGCWDQKLFARTQQDSAPIVSPNQPWLGVEMMDLFSDKEAAHVS